MGVGVICYRGEPRPSELSRRAGELGPTSQSGLLTWAAPSSLVAAALFWPWGHWSTSVSSTSRSSSPPTASFICRDQSRAQFPTPPKGLKERWGRSGEALALSTYLVQGTVCAEL